MKHSFKKSVQFFIVALALAFSALGVTPAYGGGGIRYAKPSATGTGDCGSWANACTLQTALTGAISGNEVWVMAGTHKPTTGPNREAAFQLKNGVEVYGGFAGTETLLTQRNPAANLTVLSGDIGAAGNSDNSYHVVTASGTDDTAILNGFTITAGNANGTSPHDQGGGMYNSGGSPRLVYLIFQGNDANVGGGMRNVSGNPILSNCTFAENEADFGGGMANWSSSPSLGAVFFNENSATTSGGGMHNWNSSPTINYASFFQNTATDGGGMYNASASNPALEIVQFSSNTATDKGGGMYNDASNPTLTNVTFSSNSAVFGGGMRNYNISNPTLTNVTFSSNSADYGGGMYNSSGSPTLTNVTFSGNSTNYRGGGMYNSTSNPALSNVTFSGNSAVERGGGMRNYNSSNPTIHNTVFWGNTAATAGAQIDNESSTPVLNDNVVQGGCPDGSTCTHIISDDPKLGTLGDYGGETETIPLLAGSSAIDTGNDATCAADDQRGITRPQGAHCDIGAYEADVTLTVRSVGANDGWILETGENTTKGGTKDSAAATLRLGDDSAKKQYRSILSFATGAALPDTAVITKVTLKVKKQGITGGGNPVTTFQGFMADIKKGLFGTSALQATDFQAGGVHTYGPFTTALAGGWYTIDLTAGKAYINKLTTGGGLTQIRLRFSLDDNNNAAANYLSLHSGDAAAAKRPQLIIEYYIP